MSNLRKVWRFLWDQDNIWSWIANVLIAFVVIKYLVYPGLGFLLGTPAPIVAVVSGSMEHDGRFDAWWGQESCCNDACSSKFVHGEFYDDLNISFDEFREFSFVNGFNKGDIMVLYSPENAVVGDVIVYVVPSRPDPIIHRIVKFDGTYYTTKGDHNCGVAEFESKIPKEAVIGKAVWRVPFLGWVKIWFVELVGLLR